jgi:hypothetical protein
MSYVKIVEGIATIWWLFVLGALLLLFKGFIPWHEFVSILGYAIIVECVHQYLKKRQDNKNAGA